MQIELELQEALQGTPRLRQVADDLGVPVENLKPFVTRGNPLDVAGIRFGQLCLVDFDDSWQVGLYTSQGVVKIAHFTDTYMALGCAKELQAVDLSWFDPLNPVYGTDSQKQVRVIVSKWTELDLSEEECQ